MYRRNSSSRRKVILALPHIPWQVFSERLIERWISWAEVSAGTRKEEK